MGAMGVSPDGFGSVGINGGTEGADAAGCIGGTVGAKSLVEVSAGIEGAPCCPGG